MLFRKKRRIEPEEIALDDEFDDETDGESVVPSEPGPVEPEFDEPGGDAKCVLINMLPLEWGRGVVFRQIGKLVNRTLFKRFFLLFILPVLVGSAFGVIYFLDSMEYDKLKAATEINNATVLEYETITQNLAVYNMYTAIPNSPSVYSQWFGLTYLLSRNGLLISEANFTRNLTLVSSQYLDRDGFALETGKTLQSIQPVGIWTVTGMLSPRITNKSPHDWVAGFRKQVEVLMGRYGLASYVRLVPGRSQADIALVIVLWKK